MEFAAAVHLLLVQCKLGRVHIFLRSGADEREGSTRLLSIKISADVFILLTVLHTFFASA